MAAACHDEVDDDGARPVWRSWVVGVGRPHETIVFRRVLHVRRPATLIIIIINMINYIIDISIVAVVVIIIILWRVLHKRTCNIEHGQYFSCSTLNIWLIEIDCKYIKVLKVSSRASILTAISLKQNGWSANIQRHNNHNRAQMAGSKGQILGCLWCRSVIPVVVLPLLVGVPARLVQLRHPRNRPEPLARLGNKDTQVRALDFGWNWQRLT